MATKYLARTVIEGGRTEGSKWERRMLARSDRRRAAAYARRAARDPDWEETDPRALAPSHGHSTGRAFADKLGPAHRWLKSRTGEPWNQVRSELVRRFNTKTLAGRHVVYGHLLCSVHRAGDPRPVRAGGFFVDDLRVLRHCPHPPKDREPRVDPQTIDAWLEDRRVGQVGRCLFWFVPPAYRQEKALTKREAAFFDRLPRTVKAVLLAEAPVSKLERPPACAAVDLTSARGLVSELARLRALRASREETERASR